MHKIQNLAWLQTQEVGSDIEVTHGDTGENLTLTLLCTNTTETNSRSPKRTWIFCQSGQLGSMFLPSNQQQEATTCCLQESSGAGEE